MRGNRAAVIQSCLAALCVALIPALALAQTKPPKLSASAIQIEPIETGGVSIPAEFRFATYELLIQRVRHDGKFKKVFRSGDREADAIPDLVVLRAKVSRYKEGSQLKRELTSVSGATTVDVTTTVSARDGRVLLNQTLSGNVRFFGENLGVSNDLAKHIAKLLRTNF
jgi:hypothetical protein